MRIVIRTVATMVLMAASGHGALAQSPLAIDFEEAFTPDVQQRDVSTIRGGLVLDADQTSIVESLVHDYSEQFDQALTGVREDLRAAQAALGVEDPSIDRQREELRQEIATIFEKMQQELADLPAGANADEIKQKYEQQVQSIQSRMQQLQAKPMVSDELRKMFDDASARLEQWRGVKKQMHAKFAGDVQAILRDEQRERWPAVERRLLRERTLGRGRLQGESVDLVLLVRDLKLDAAQYQTIAAAMLDYEVALDAALRSRNDLSESSERAIFKAVNGSDRQGLSSLIERITQARVGVRQVNDDTAAGVATALGAEAGQPGARLTEAYRQRAYSVVFRDTQTLRLFKAARELGGLPAAQAEALEALQKAYEAELASKNQQVLAAVRQHEPARITLSEIHRLLPPEPEAENAERDRGNDGMQESFAQRQELGRNYDAQLQAVLGPELYERLPRNDRLNSPDKAVPSDDRDQ